MDEMTIERCQDPEAPGKLALKLAGRVTIGQADGFRKALLEALGAALELGVDLSAVTEIDITGLQLLCATQRSAQALGRQFSISDGGNGVFLDALNEAGIPQHAWPGCEASGPCIQIGGEC